MNFLLFILITIFAILTGSGIYLIGLAIRNLKAWYSSHVYHTGLWWFSGGFSGLLFLYLINMEKQFTTKEMESVLLANGWFEMEWTTGFWGNIVEPGFWPTKDAFDQIDRINELHHELTKGWKFIPESV